MKRIIMGIIVLIFAIGGIPSKATVFIPADIATQVEEASGAAEVELTSSRSVKNISGHISTEYTFKIIRSFHLDDSDLDKEKSLKLTLPGGTSEGISTVVDGSPHFELNKKYFLLLKRIDSKIYLSNFTMGKFDFVISDGEEYLVNEVFPARINVGKVSKNYLMKIINEKWKTKDRVELNLRKSSSVVNTEKYRESHDKIGSKENGRRPTSEEEREQSLPSIGVKFFLEILGVAIVLFFVWKRQKKS